MLSQSNITVDAVDLQRYMGRWYEIARLPTYFERGCDNVFAEYSIATPQSITEKSEIRINVHNQCICNGKIKSIEGLARVIDTQTCSKLQVSFTPYLPWFLAGGSYWILNLDQTNYSWVMVGNPQKTCLWIMSRNPYMDWVVYNYLINEAVAKGFDISKVMLTNQDENTYLLQESTTQDSYHMNILPEYPFSNIEL
jgi:apolipoprotein D and lipocalin family protein